MTYKKYVRMVHSNTNVLGELMFRIVELIGLLAPLAGIVLLVLYRRRAVSGAAWGIAGCSLALLASAIGLSGEGLAALGILGGGDFSQQLHAWSLMRFAVLVFALVLLVVGSLSGRGGRAWSRNGGVIALVGCGLGLALLGALVQLLPVDLGPQHEGLTTLLEIVMETIQFALMGVGVLFLCLAVVSGRPRTDDRGEPSELVGRSVAHAWRLYRQLHARRR